MLDRFNREINYLRISVTDRCNLRCTYCMPAEGIKLMTHNEVLSLEEIVEITQIAVQKFGIKKVRLTGGEPLVRKGIIKLVSMLNKIEGLSEITMSTNGILLEEYAQDLKDAGLTRVNISLDTLDPTKYKQLTRGGDIERVKAGIQAAQKAQLFPIKINAVRPKDYDKQDLQKVIDYCQKEKLELRFINLMDLKTGTFSQVENGESGNCKTCNRLRLTANGNIKPCLFSNKTYNIREMGIENAFLTALKMKPERGDISTSHDFYNIGG